jgi:integral membrane sensor domain MASE1
MQLFRVAVWVAVLYLATGFASEAVARSATESVPVWLASGVMFSALLVCARWSWPSILAGGWLAATAWGVIAHGLGAGGAIAFGAIEALSMAVGAWVTTLGRHDLERPPGAALLIAGALLAASLGGLLAVQFWAWQRPGADPWNEWLAWTFSTGVGLLLVAPLVVAFRGFRVRRSGGMPMPQFLGGGLAFLAFVVTVLVVFADGVDDRFGALASTLAYLPMPMLIIAALLWGPRGGSVAMLLGALLIVLRTARGGGPFAVVEDFTGEAVIEVQGFVAVWAVVMLLMRALSEGRRASLLQAQSWRLRYERTMLAVGVASVEYDAVTGRATWGEGAALVLGPAVGNVDTVSDWLDRIDTAERGLVQANWSAVARGDLSASEQDYAVHLGGGRTTRVNEQLANVRGGDGNVEQVVALLRLLPSEAKAEVLS